MNRGLRRSAVLLFGLMVIMQFNNCGVYEVENGEASSSSLTECPSESTCVTNSVANLKIQPLPIDNFTVPAALMAFNVGGDCNEAGFSNHRISWALKRNNVAVRTSGMLIHGKSWHSTCVNGKFRLYVNLAWNTTAGPSEDPVDRTGLMYGAGTNRSAYVLEVEIMAQNATGEWIRNTNQGSLKQVHLVPLATTSSL